ncbi:MAG: 2-hydroxychromene-2-carboxylate isomerase [Rhodoferax sp.]|nr:2-hydroxychromene-2-carboxylate isomerase [Rhodoferax sp.]
MKKTVDFYFDFGSPAAYLAYTQLPKLRADTGATVVMKPVLLGGVFQSTGNRPPISVPLKGGYLFVDFARHAKRYGVPLVMNPFFPINTITLMRADVGMGLRGDSRLDAYRDAMFRAIWVDQQNLNDPATAAAVLTASGFDPGAIMALVADPQIKDALRAATQAAVDRGIFGAPTFFVGDQMFWGQDRLDFVREALG